MRISTARSIRLARSRNRGRGVATTQRRARVLADARPPTVRTGRGAWKLFGPCCDDCAQHKPCSGCG